MELESAVGFSLFADDGAIWKRWRNLEFIVNKLQGAIKLKNGHINGALSDKDNGFLQGKELKVKSNLNFTNKNWKG